MTYPDVVPGDIFALDATPGRLIRAMALTDDTLRDLFAAMALTGLVNRTPDDQVVASAYNLADAMMEERKRRYASTESGK